MITFMKKPLIWETIVLLLTVWALNYTANLYHLYWSIYEFDSLVHFVGGAALSAFFIWAYFFSGFFDPQKRSLKNFLLVAFLGAMSVALIWEIYEIFMGEVAVSGAEYPYDTMMDLIMDFLGAVAFCFYGYIKEYNQKMIIKNQNE